MSTESEVFQFLYAAATYIVTGQDLAKLLRLAACFTGVGATGRKAAAGFGINGRDKLAFQDNALFLVVDIRGGNRREKRFCVRVQRFGEQLLGWTCLDELAQILCEI